MPSNLVITRPLSTPTPRETEPAPSGSLANETVRQVQAPARATAVQGNIPADGLSLQQARTELGALGLRQLPTDAAASAADARADELEDLQLLAEFGPELMRELKELDEVAFTERTGPEFDQDFAGLQLQASLDEIEFEFDAAVHVDENASPEENLTVLNELYQVIALQIEAEEGLLSKEVEILTQASGSGGWLNSLQNDYDDLEEIDTALSRPLRLANPAAQEAELQQLTGSATSMDEAFDAELAGLEVELGSQASDPLGDMVSEVAGNVLQSSNLLDACKRQLVQVQGLMVDQQVRAGYVTRDSQGRLSYQTEANLKKAGQLGLTVASKFGPLQAVTQPVKATLSAVSLAKTLMHMVKLREIKKTVAKDDPAVCSHIDYLMSQKASKATRKAVSTVGAGMASTAYAACRNLYKKANGTLGVEREAQAKGLHQLARQGNPAAVAVVKELVREAHQTEALGPEGWAVLKAKSAST